MNQLQKEKWVEETLESLNDIQRVPAPADLFERAMQRAAQGSARIVRMPVAQVWSAAACALVLVVANLFMCLDFARPSQKAAPNAKEMFVQEYFGTNDALPF